MTVSSRLQCFHPKTNTLKIFLSFKYMAVDSNMIHICIYIFTINHFSRYIKKTLRILLYY